MRITVKAFFSLLFFIAVGVFFFTIPNQIHNVVKAVGDVGPVINITENGYDIPMKSYSLSPYILYGVANDEEGDVINRVEIQDELGNSVGNCTAIDESFDSSYEEIACIVSNPTLGDNTVYILGYDANNFASEFAYEYLFIVTDPSAVNGPLEAWDFDDQYNDPRYGYVPISGYEYPNAVIDGYTNRAISFDNFSYAYPDPFGSFSFAGTSSTFYVEGFVKKDDFTGGGNKGVIAKMNEDWTQNTWAMGVDNNGGVYCAVWTTEGVERSVTSSSDGHYLSSGEWNRIGCEWNGTTGHLTAYLMDIAVSTAEYPGTEIPSSSNKIVINPEPINEELPLFNGSIDRIRIFNNRAAYTSYVLSELEEVDMFTSQQSPYETYENPFILNVEFNHEPDRFIIKVETNLDSSGVWANNCVRDEYVYHCTFTDLPIGVHNIEILGTSADNSTESSIFSVEIVDPPIQTQILLSHLAFEDNINDEYDFLPQGTIQGEIEYITGSTGKGISVYNGSRVEISDPDGIVNFAGSNAEFAVEAYVKADDFTGGYRRVVGKMNNDLTENAWLLGIDTNGGLYCGIWNNSGDQQSFDTSNIGEYLTLGEWNKIGCSWNANTRTLKGYINGTMVLSAIYDEGTTIVSSDKDLIIGAQTDGNQSFTGYIDEVKIYNYSTALDPVALSDIFTFDNQYKVVSADTTTMTGSATYDEAISSIQYREYVDNQDDITGWIDCTCTDDTCDSTQESFSCDVDSPYSSQRKIYEIRVGTGTPATYISSERYETFELLREEESKLSTWWTFDSTDTLIDRSGNNLDGNVMNTLSTGTSSDTSSSVNIFSEDGYFLIPDDNRLLNFSGTTSEFTVEALIKPSVDLNTDQKYIIIQKKANNDDMIWELGIIGGRNVVSSLVKTSQGVIGFDTTQTVTLGEWNRIKLSFSNLDQTYTIQINDNAPDPCTWFKSFDMPESTGNVSIGADRNGDLKFLGEIDDIRILNTADARAPEASVQPLSNPERVTNANQPFNITVTDETGVADFEYLFYDGPFGDNLDAEAWVQVENPTTGSWGDKSIGITITAPDLSDGEWYMYMRSTDTNKFKNVYAVDGWYANVSEVTPSAMPYYRFVIETEDNTPPLIFAQSIVPNPTVDRNPGVRGYVKDYMTEGVGDTPSNIESIEYRLTQDGVEGDWTPVPPLNGLNSPFEEFYFQFENLVPGNYDLEIKASDAAGNTTESNNTNHNESFIIYEPDVLPETSIIDKEEDFNTHQYHDVLFSDGIWGNGILRLRQEIDFSQETALFTNNSEFGFKFGSAITGTYKSIDGNLWIVTNDQSIIYYNISNGSYIKYAPYRPGELRGVREFQYQNKRYLMIYTNDENSSFLIRDINNTPMDPNDDTFADYGTKTDFEGFERFKPFTIDTRNEKLAYYAVVGSGIQDVNEPIREFFIWIDTKGTIMNVEDDTYVTWGTSDNLFIKGVDPDTDLPVYQTDDDFTASYFDLTNNTLVAVSYASGIYECNDGGTPEDKSDDVCRKHQDPNNTYHVFSILKDPNGYYWLGGDDNLARVDSKETSNIFDDTYEQVLSYEQIGYENISQIEWISGEYPVGDEVWMLTRSGHIKALEFNYTYDDVLDDTQYQYRIRDIDNRAGDMSTFAMTDRNTIYLTLQGYGLQKISLTRGFENTNVIEMLPIPPDGILSINYIDLEEVLGHVTQGSIHTFNELVSYEVSNDSGLTWYPITQGQRVQFPTPDYKLKFRIILNRGSSPIIDLIKLSYVTYASQEISEQCDIKITEKAPVITSIQPMGTNSMEIKFTGIQDETEIQKYVLEYGLSSTVFQYTPIDLAPSATSYTISGLSLNTDYFFRLKAVTDCSQSSWSNVLSAKHTGQPAQPPVVQPPVEPPTIPGTINMLCGETCTIDSDCTDQNNICIAGKCQLDPNSCSVSEQLDDNKCTCKQESSIGGMCGQPCSVDTQCTEKNNKCIDGLCKLTECPLGYQLNDNSCGCIENTVETTTGVVKSIIDKVSKAISSVVNIINDIPISAQTAETATNITMVTVVTASLASTVLGASYPRSFVIQGVAYALGIMKLRKKSRDYGLVYDAVTKEPLNRAIIRIFDINNKLIDTEVTDVYGVFETHIKENGQYKIQVMARNYDYPSKIVIGDTDGTYEHIYHGGMFIYDKNIPVDFSIPVDPYNKDVPGYSKAIFMSRISTIFYKLQNILVIFGLVFSIVTYIKNPLTFNLLILIAYLIFMIINIKVYLQGRHKYGIVQDLMLTPKAGISIGLRELEFQAIKSQRVTDDNGRYRFIVPGGKYKIEVLDSQYEIVQDTNLTVDNKSKGVMVINKNIRVRHRA